jgi:hypothetical protein
MIGYRVEEFAPIFEKPNIKQVIIASLVKGSNAHQGQTLQRVYASTSAILHPPELEANTGPSPAISA